MDSAFVEDVFARFGKVAIKRMFGGQGVYASGVMFALTYDDAIYLKTDDALRKDLSAMGSAPFSYTRAGKKTAMSYWRLPESALDDPDEAAQWARRAVAAARAKAAGKKKTR